MIVTLLPFFLAANIAINETDWKYGPEVVYKAQINGTLDTHKYNTVVKLLCRPKSDLILSCHFSDWDSKLKILPNDYFELKFNRYGIEKIVVASSIRPVKLDMIRALILQLHVGTDLTNQFTNSFDVMEKSAAGKCRTSYVSGMNDVDENYVKGDEEEPYEIVMLPGGVSLSGKIRQIQRTRHIDDCPFRINYFFGSREAYKENRTIDAILISSMSEMDITRNTFESFTENTVHLRNIGFPNRRSDMIQERLTVSLINIVPASGPLTNINDPSNASVFPTTQLTTPLPEEN